MLILNNNYLWRIQLKTVRSSTWASVIAIIFVTLACNVLTGKPSVSNIRMATDDTGKTSTTTYIPGDDFYIFADLNGLHPGSVVQAKWYAVSAKGLDPNSVINTSDYTYETGIYFIYFKLTTNDGSDWPSGSYRVEIYLEGIKTGEQTFTVN
jgi:hypothetical protein